MAFDAADITCDSSYEPPEGGARRQSVEQYYHTLNLKQPTDARKFLAVAAAVIADLDALAKESPSLAEGTIANRTRIVSALAADGWDFVDGRFRAQGAASHLSEVSASAARLDSPELQRQIERMRSSVDSDPALTLGTAKELVETTCKTILEEHGRTADPDWDIGRLIKETREVLRLLPSDIPDSAKGADAIKRLLANLGSVVQGLGELRNLYGTGHGRSGKRRGVEPRHARLASGAAAALVTFLLETHWQRTE